MGPPASYRVSRVRYYSGVIYVYPDFVYGSFTLFARLFQNRSTILLESFMMIRNPDNKLSVWPPSRSLAATWEIDVSFSSWSYLDVSVHSVSFSQTIYSSEDTCTLLQVGSPIRKSAVHIGYLLLTAAYRSLSRPSSAPSAKASALCSF